MRFKETCIYIIYIYIYIYVLYTYTYTYIYVTILVKPVVNVGLVCTIWTLTWTWKKQFLLDPSKYFILDLSKSRKKSDVPSLVRPQGPILCLEQRLGDKRSTRHPNTLWLGLNRVMLSFGKIECKSVYHTITYHTYYTNWITASLLYHCHNFHISKHTHRSVITCPTSTINS